MSKPLIGVIVGSSRQGRLGEMHAHWIYRLAERRSDLRLELIDLGNQGLPFLAEPVSPLAGDAQRTAALRWAAVLDRLDGFIVVRLEDAHARHTDPAADPIRLRKAFARKPVAFVGFGASVDTRSVEPLRSLASEMQMAPVGHAVHVSLSEAMSIWQLDKCFDDFPHLGRTASAMLDDLSWWAHALKAARCKEGMVRALARRIRLAASRVGAGVAGGSQRASLRLSP